MMIFALEFHTKNFKGHVFFFNFRIAMHSMAESACFTGLAVHSLVQFFSSIRCVWPAMRCEHTEESVWSHLTLGYPHTSTQQPSDARVRPDVKEDGTYAAEGVPSPAQPPTLPDDATRRAVRNERTT